MAIKGRNDGHDVEDLLQQEAKKGADSPCSALCKLCSSLNIIEFQICDRPVAGNVLLDAFPIFPYFSNFFHILVPIDAFCSAGWAEACSHAREKLVHLSSTRLCVGKCNQLFVVFVSYDF